VTDDQDLLLLIEPPPPAVITLIFSPCDAPPVPHVSIWVDPVPGATRYQLVSGNSHLAEAADPHFAVPASVCDRPMQVLAFDVRGRLLRRQPTAAAA
jgi:hypothetical protein